MALSIAAASLATKKQHLTSLSAFILQSPNSSALTNGIAESFVSVFSEQRTQKNGNSKL